MSGVTASTVLTTVLTLYTNAEPIPSATAIAVLQPAIGKSIASKTEHRASVSLLKGRPETLYESGKAQNIQCPVKLANIPQ
jgi:hypothetical protein